MKKLIITAIALLLIFALCACGDVDIKSDPSEPLRYETNDAILSYTGQSYPGNGLFVRTESGGDVSKTLLLHFDYTNLTEEPSNYRAAFMLTATQNGNTLAAPEEYNEYCTPTELKNALNLVLPQSTHHFALALTLEDDSPVTVTARRTDNNEAFTTMTVTPEPYVDRAFDITRLYGFWEDTDTKYYFLNQERDGEMLFSLMKGEIWTSSSSFWTDEDHLYLYFIGKGVMTYDIIEKPGEPLCLASDYFNFVQYKSQDENAATAPRTVWRTFDFTKELPSPRSFMDEYSSVAWNMFEAAWSEIGLDGKHFYTYRYDNGSAHLEEYVNCLKEYGMDVQSADDGSYRIELPDDLDVRIYSDHNEMCIEFSCPTVIWG